jgi:hypothetical protein
MAMHATLRTTLGVVVLAAAAVSMSACSFNARNDGTGVRGTTVPMTFERKAALGIITTEEAIGEDPALQQQYVGPVSGAGMAPPAD